MYRSFPKTAVSLCKSTHSEAVMGGKRGESNQAQDKKLLRGFESNLSGFLPSPSTWGEMVL